MKPTLFISLGGTGMEIAHRLRRRILTHPWGSIDNSVHVDDLNEFPLAQFIYIDLDQAGESRPDIEPVKFKEEEKVVRKLNLDKYFRDDRDINRYPHIAEWFPVAPAWIRKWIDVASERANNHTPTQQPRFFSRLYLFDNYAMLKSMIQGKIRSLLAGVSNRSGIERLGLEMEPTSLRVVVIASTAGCTGSGLFLDMGYLAKWLAKNEIREGVKIDLLLMLPSGYGDSGHGKAHSEANTYAALMELETCMGHGDRFVRGWSNSECPDLPQTPYDDVFLFDAGNIAKKTAEASDLFDVIADILFEDFIQSDFSSRKARNAVHQMQHKIGPFSPPAVNLKYDSLKMMCSKAYSAFGQSVIDTHLLQQHCNNNSGHVNKTLIAMLEEMSTPERMALFQHCIERAMPWVEADLDVLWPLNPYQFAFIVGVDGVRDFDHKFGKEFCAVAPIQAVKPAAMIGFYESGAPGRLTCYVELSGIPLTALTKLPKWRKSYAEESKTVPVHIHKDRTLFVHPLAPSSATLDRIDDEPPPID